MPRHRNQQMRDHHPATRSCVSPRPNRSVLLLDVLLSRIGTRWASVARLEIAGIAHRLAALQTLVPCRCGLPARRTLLHSHIQFSQLPAVMRIGTVSDFAHVASHRTPPKPRQPQNVATVFCATPPLSPPRTHQSDAFQPPGQRFGPPTKRRVTDLKEAHEPPHHRDPPDSKGSTGSP